MENFFDKDKVKRSTFQPSDTFGMDLNQRNFPNWQERLPALDTTPEGIAAARADLEESLTSEFKPGTLESHSGRKLTAKESELVSEFKNDTLRALSVISGGRDPLEDEEMEDGELAWESGPGVEIDSSGYQYSKSKSVLCEDERTGERFHSRVLVSFHEIRDKSDPDSSTWLLPDISGHNESVTNDEGSALEPERFESGPVALAHVLMGRMGRPAEGESALVVRFCDQAFREAVEHFVAKHAGMPEARGRYSYVHELVQSELEKVHAGQEVEITDLRLVESRMDASIFHFALGVNVGEGNLVEDFAVSLNALGAMMLKRM